MKMCRPITLIASALSQVGSHDADDRAPGEQGATAFPEPAIRRIAAAGQNRAATERALPMNSLWPYPPETAKSHFKFSILNS
jgi:hypothetical protein